VTLPGINRSPAALPSYNVFPFAEMMRRALPGGRELWAYQNAGRSSFPGMRPMLWQQTVSGGDKRVPQSGQKS